MRSVLNRGGGLRPDCHRVPKARVLVNLVNGPGVLCVCANMLLCELRSTFQMRLTTSPKPSPVIRTAASDEWLATSFCDRRKGRKPHRSEGTPLSQDARL